MTRHAAPVLAVLAVLLAGCMGAANGPDDGVSPAGNESDGDVQVGDRPDPTFTDVATGPGAAPDAAATLHAAPEWQVGEWWRIRFTSPLTGETVEFVRVVADKHAEGYVVGMPHEGWYKEAVVYHAPGFGDVNPDLSFNTHNELFTPVKFPLTEDQSWTTTFSGGPEMTASVSVEDERVARVTFTNANGGTPVTLVYDAAIHEVREFVHPTVEYEVIDHGYDFTGWITVPRGEDLVFFHGRIGPALDLGFTPAAPVESVEVTGGFNRLTFIQVVGGFTPAPGVYREYAKAPDGTEYVTEAVPGGGLSVTFFEHANPDGVWDLQHVVGGAGVSFIEGIAYHQYDIKLPEGTRRADHAHEVIR